MSESFTASIGNSTTVFPTDSSSRASDFESSTSTSSSGRFSIFTSSIAASAPTVAANFTSGGISAFAPTPPPTPFTSSADASLSATTTGSVIHPVQNTTHSSGAGLSTPKIIVIAVSASVGGLLLIGLILFLIWRSRGAKSNRHNKAPSHNVDAETMEKFAPPPEYKQLNHGKGSPETETKVSLPFIRTSFGESRRSSRLSAELARYRDAPPSPFVNGEIETTQAPLEHAVSLADATPFNEYMDEAQLDPTPGVLPNPHPRPKRASQQLPLISIPSPYVPPTRKPTNGKRVSRRGSKHMYRAVDTGEQSDVDSESMYSQASAYSMAHSEHDPEDAPSTVQQSPFSASLVREKRESNVSAMTIRPGNSTAAVETQQTDTEGSVVWLDRDPAPSEHGTETTGELSLENTVVVAQLLKSRVKADQPPARSGSVVSHIERKGSIRPAERAVRPLRVSRKGREPGSVAQEGN